MKTKARVKKLRSREVESRMREQGPAEAGDVFFDSSTFLATITKEQTGNVYENKGQGQKVEESRSRESDARA